MSVISLKTRQKYGSLLAGNPFYVPPSFDSIATVTAAGGETSLTFSSIPSTYQHLQIRGVAQNLSQAYLDIQANGVTSASYSTHSFWSNGASSTAYSEASANRILGSYGVVIPQSSNNSFLGIVIDIHDYNSTTNNKTFRCFVGNDRNGSGEIGMTSGTFLSTNSITSLTLKPSSQSFNAGTTFALYGIR